MTKANRQTQTAPIWVVGSIVLLFVIVALLFAFWNNSRLSSSNSLEQPQPAGGALIPPEIAGATNAVAEIDTRQPILVQPGQVVRVTATRGDRAELRADASRDAILMEILLPDIELTIVDPSGDYSQYPVIQDGITWYRVRSRDGIVGWLDGALLDLAEGPTEENAEPVGEPAAQPTPTSTPAG